jgi:very-short-patch-repair endonuclease
MPPKRSTPRTLHRAWELRREPTPAEIKLWAHLRILRQDGIHFRRQHAIGPYITDFCAPRKRLVIELDGSHHLNEGEHDEDRAAYLALQGYKVIRFWNDQVMNDMQSVAKAITQALDASG